MRIGIFAILRAKTKVARLSIRSQIYALFNRQQHPIAVVTGTSTGFGNLTAILLAEAGYRVYGTMRDTDGRNAAAKAALEARGIHVYEMDVTAQASVDAGASAILRDAGRVDVLINNAGISHMGITEAFTAEAVEHQFAANVIGPVRVNRAFLPAMRKAGSGLVVFVSSNVGRMVLPFMGVYGASPTSSGRPASRSRSSNPRHTQPTSSTRSSAPTIPRERPSMPKPRATWTS